jgi:recombination protein RecA
MSPEQKSALELVCESVNKKYGSGSVMRFTETPSFDPDSVVSTGSIGLDSALGIGGWPRGRIIELWGEPSSGKSTICLHTIANAQKKGITCLYMDLENSYDAIYAESLGVDNKKILLSQTEAAEDALNIVVDFLKTGNVGLVIVDSAAALTPRAELEADIEKQLPGLQARILSKALRVMVSLIKRTNALVIFTNQTRNRLGITYGSPVTTCSGKALPFYASIRAKVARTGDAKDKQETTGNLTKVEIIKSKCAPPKKIAEFEIKFGKGIDQDAELLDLASQDGIIVKSGAWYKYNNESIGQGKDNTINWLNDHLDIKETIRKEVLANRGL